MKRRKRAYFPFVSLNFTWSFDILVFFKFRFFNFMTEIQIMSPKLLNSCQYFFKKKLYNIL